MRVAYLLHWNAGPESGVFQKVLAQAGQWANLGVEVALFLLSATDGGEAWKAKLGDIPVFVETYAGYLTKFKAMGVLVRALRGWRPDVVYHRYDLYYPALETLGRALPVVLEVNTDDLSEFRLGPAYRYWYHRLSRHRILRGAKGIVFVTEELRELRHFARFGQPAKVIANGIDLQRVSCLPPCVNEAPRLVFIGSAGQPWHGVDKILYLAKLFVDWHFDLIGVGTVDCGEALPPNVVAHGQMNRPEYEEIMRHADVAIGTLALHRKAMDEACPLKVREYLAYGLPVITGYRDTDFPEPTDFLLQLPNCSDNVTNCSDQIEEFVMAWLGKRVPRQAIAHLDVRFKEKQRLAFFGEVTGKEAIG